MISVSLPPVFVSSQLGYAEVLEAHAVTYWARYNTQPISARVLTAHQRAWSVVDAQMFPRTAAFPGMCAVRIGTGDAYRVVIGIEGSQTTGNIMSSLDALGATSIAGCPGWISKFVRDAFVGVSAMIDPLTPLGSALTNPRVPVTFAGHSLGGAVAEVWACALKAAIPGKSVRYVSFGSPRVGSQAWVDGKNPGIKWQHVYTYRDMIHGIPQDNMISLQGLTAGATFGASITFYVRDETCLTLNRIGQRLRGLPERGFFDTHPSWAAIFNQMRQPISPANYWWTHTSENYRAYLMTWAKALPAELWYRYCHLEYENENQWQVLHQPGSEFQVGFNNLVLPGPAEAQPPTREIAALAGAAPPEEVPQGQIDPAIDAEPPGAGGGDSWETPPLTVTRQLPQRRTRLRN